jgi:hypothetical protein
VRFETQGDDKPLKQEVVGTGELTRQQFKNLLKAAHQPSAVAYRSELRMKLMPKDFSADVGKTVFFKDLDFYGLLPKTLGIDDAITIGSLTVQTALRNRKALETLKPKRAEFTAFMGYPETEGDRDTIFGTQKTASLQLWRQRAQALRDAAEEHGFKLFAAGDLRTLGTKQKILEQIQAAKGVVFVVAHADGCHIHLPGGEIVSLSPSDIAGLKLTESPFVILRICNGIDNGFASAFMRAGASAVWANRGVISADNANQQITLFMKYLSDGLSALEAARQVEKVNPQAKASVGLFTKLFARPGTEETP